MPWSRLSVIRIDTRHFTNARPPGANHCTNIGVGYNNIAIDTARAQGVAVSNTPDVLTDATADIALLLILATTRRAYASERKLRENRWNDFSLSCTALGSSVQGKNAWHHRHGAYWPGNRQARSIWFGHESHFL